MDKQLDLFADNNLNAKDKEHLIQEQREKALQDLGVEMAEKKPSYITKIAVNNYVRYQDGFYKIDSVMRKNVFCTRLTQEKGIICFAVNELQGASDNVLELLQKGDVIVVKNQYCNIQEVIFLQFLSDGIYVYDEYYEQGMVLKDFEFLRLKGRLQDDDEPKEGV